MADHERLPHRQTPGAGYVLVSQYVARLQVLRSQQARPSWPHGTQAPASQAPRTDVPSMVVRHGLSQRPQWSRSVVVSTQTPPQGVCPLGHAHTPLVHENPNEQSPVPQHGSPTFPQLRQLPATHSVPTPQLLAAQHGSPAFPQLWQLPATHSVPAAHSCPQLPQFHVSAMRFAHTPAVHASAAVAHAHIERIASPRQLYEGRHLVAPAAQTPAATMISSRFVQRADVISESKLERSVATHASQEVGKHVGQSHCAISTHTTSSAHCTGSPESSSTVPSQSLSTASPQRSRAPPYTSARLSSQSVPPHTRGGSPSPSPSSTVCVHTRAAGSQCSLTVHASVSAQSRSLPHARPGVQSVMGSQLSPTAHAAGVSTCRQAPVAIVHVSVVQPTESAHSVSLVQPGGPAS